MYVYEHEEKLTIIKMKLLKKENIFKRLLIPTLGTLISGLAILSVQYLLKDSKKIKYENIELTIFHNIDEDGISKVVNGKTNKSSFAHKVIFENSGNLPIKDFIVEYKLNSEFKDIKLTNLNHHTFPEKNFGEIEIQRVENNMIKIKYALINPNERFETFLFHNREASLSVYPRGEGVSVEEGGLLFPNYFYFLIILPLVFIVLTFIYPKHNKIPKSYLEELQKAWDYYSERKQRGEIK